MDVIITIKIDGDNVKVSTETFGDAKKTAVDGLNAASDYARYFNEGCVGWTTDAEYNLMFLRDQQRYANDMLRSRGYLFLNDVYKMLDIPLTKAGQIVGWVYDDDQPIGDNFVDFGLGMESNRDFVNGIENVALLDFNVDGNILDYI